MLNIGEKIFIAGYGAGYIQDMDDRELSGIMCEYVNIYLLLDNMNFMIPIKRIGNYKIRKALNKIELEKVLNTISNEADNIEGNWNNRYRISKKKIQSGNTLKMCQVIRDLYHLKKEGMIPPGELKILERVEGMVASEIMLVLELSMQESLGKIWSFI